MFQQLQSKESKVEIGLMDENKCEERKKAEESVKRRRRERRRGEVKSSELDKETCGILVKGTRVNRVRQSVDERLPE